MGLGRGYSAGRCSAGLLAAADFLWSAVVVAPLVVTYWRGSWDLLRDTGEASLRRGCSWPAGKVKLGVTTE